MKQNKFGKLQKLLLDAAEKSGVKGCPLSKLYKLAFPGSEYTYSYLIPVIRRMEYQGLLKIDWKLSLAYSRGNKKWRENVSR